MNKEIERSRMDFEKMGENYPEADGVIINKEVIENIECYWFRPTEKTDNS